MAYSLGLARTVQNDREPKQNIFPSGLVLLCPLNGMLVHSMLPLVFVRLHNNLPLLIYKQVSLRQTPLGLALPVHHREVSGLQRDKKYSTEKWHAGTNTEVSVKRELTVHPLVERGTLVARCLFQEHNCTMSLTSAQMWTRDQHANLVESQLK